MKFGVRGSGVQGSGLRDPYKLVLDLNGWVWGVGSRGKGCMGLAFGLGFWG